TCALPISTGLHAVVGMCTKHVHTLEAITDACLDACRQSGYQRVDGTRLERNIRCLDSLVDRCTRGQQPPIRCALPLAVHPHECLEEPQVRECTCLGIPGAHPQRPLECR